MRFGTRLAGLPRTARIAAVAGTVLIVASALAAPPRYRATILPALPGAVSAFPTAMEAVGTIVGVAGEDRFDPLVTPVIAAGSQLAPLALPPDSSQNFPFDLNGNGLIVGASSMQAFSWLNGVGAPLPGIGAPGFAYGVNAAGQIVGGEINDFQGIEFPVYWADRETFSTPLAGLEGHSPVGAAFAINAAGQIAGALLGDSGYVAVRWNDPAAGPTAIGGLAGSSLSEFLDINAGGDMAGRSSFPDFSTQAMLYTAGNGQLVGLGTLGGNYSYAHALNDARQVVGDANVGGKSHGFLWRGGTMHDLNGLVASEDAPFAYVFSAYDINNAGQIAAEVVLGDGTHRFARLTPIARGDLNCDGAFNFFDIDPFILALFSPPGYAAQYPRCSIFLADVNHDTYVDFFDIDPFVGCLFGGPCP